LTSLWPGGACEPCETPDENGKVHHEKCIGWARDGLGFCGCAAGLCGLRLLTGVLWDITDDQGEL
jgi:hypothetical protein